jgi:DNA-binding transcriptional LysR family regulator
MEAALVDWDRWQTLLAVFRHGTYAGAARALRVDATTIARRLKQLEKEVGYPLLMRENDRFCPTRRCEPLLAHIETAAEALRGAEQQSADAETGSVWRELCMTAPPFLAANLFAPALATLVRNRRLRVELRGTANRVMLPRREADIAIRIEDRPQDFGTGAANVTGERIGMLGYAVYCASFEAPDTLPWAGLIEQYAPTTGADMMVRLAGSDGFRYQVNHFSSLREIVASGVARALLPQFVADQDSRLTRVSDTVLEQPLWMLYHRQDRDIPYMRSARDWISALCKERL